MKRIVGRVLNPRRGENLDACSVESLIASVSERYKDTESNAIVVMGPLGSKTLVVIYGGTDGDVKVLTVYRTERIEELLSSKVGRGAWRKVE